MRRCWTVILLLSLCLAAPAQEVLAPWKALSDSITRVMGYDPVPGNSVQLFQSGEAFIASLLKDINEAKESIDLEYYWMSKDEVGTPVRDALIRKAGEGLRVRVVVDNRIVPLVPKSFFRKMEKGGVELRFSKDFEKTRLWELPGMLLGERDHRKIVILDRRTCYTGGMNLCQEILEWGDTHMRIEGPLTASLLSLFEETWCLLGGQPAPDAPEKAWEETHTPALAQLIYGDGSAILEDIYLQVLDGVQRYIYFRSPYMVPPPRLLEALKKTARRGVDVRILLPLKSDWPFMSDITRYYYESLHQAGVRLYTYAPAYNHTKGFVADDYLSSYGTVNLDNRSFYINWEDAVFFYDETLAQEHLTDFLSMLAQSQEVLPGSAPIVGLEKTWVNFLLSVAPIL